MSSDSNQEIMRTLLSAQDGVVPEETLEKLFPNQEAYNATMRGLAPKLGDLGLELIRTTFRGKKVFTLGIQSNNIPLSDDLLGCLVFITAYLKENGETVPASQFEELFVEILPEIEVLVSQGYLVKTEEEYILHPRTKVLLKNMYKTLDFQKLI